LRLELRFKINSEAEQYHRQVFHLHGQPQAQIAFIEIDPQKMILRGQLEKSPCNVCSTREPCKKCDKLRKYNENEAEGNPPGKWKTPPAAWRPF